MYEVERKARVDHGRLRPALEREGASHVSTFRLRDVYFAHPSRDFSTSDEALRIRYREVVGGMGNDSAELTYKGPRLDGPAKSRTELESRVDDANQVRAILESLGFDPVATVSKRREIYHLSECSICLDAVDELGEFVEVEITSERDGIDDASRRAAVVLEHLGVGRSNEIEESYLELLLEKRVE